MPPPQIRCHRRLKPCRICRTAAAAAQKPAAATQDKTKTRNFLHLRLYGYNDHDYITNGYLDINTKNNVYRNSRTPVNSVRVITCVHATPIIVTTEEKRGDQEGTKGADPSETQLMMTWRKR
jgi:uncharacterized protein YunC (DUF1805 family)